MSLLDRGCPSDLLGFKEEQAELIILLVILMALIYLAHRK